jgi:DNA-binding SARP family transcriptional activator
MATALGRALAGMVLVAVVAGVPTALGTVGSPLPAHWSWSHLVTDLRLGYVPSAAVVKVALLAGWAAWAFVAYEVVAEATSWARRHASRHSSALGPLQPVLAKLVAAVVLSAPLPGRGIGWGGGAPALADAVALCADAVPSPVPPTAVPTVLPTYVVQPHDTLWGIAERHLGDPLRWSEIAVLNEGRQEGRARFEDPNWIYPGWVLVLPADATDLEAYVPASPAVSLEPAHQADAPGPEDPGSADAPPTSAGTAPAAAPPTSAGTAPAAAPPTSAGTAPAAGPSRAHQPPRPQLERARADGTPTSAATRLSAGGVARRSGASSAGRSHQVGAHIPATPVGLGILGAGVVLLLDRMRRARQRRQPRGIRIDLPEGELADLERGLRAAADVELTLSVDVAVRLLGGMVAKGECSPPRVVAVRSRHDCLELVLDDPSGQDPPPPFEVTSDAGVWKLARNWSANLPRAQAQAVSMGEAPAPTLVTLGADALGTVLVDVEQLGSLVVTGADADMVLQGMVVELATVPWGDGADIVVVGGPELRGLERARSAPSVAAALAEVRARLVAAEHLLCQAEVPTAAEGRWRVGGPAWDPVVVVCLPAASRTEPAAVARLLELAGGGERGLVALVGADRPPQASRWSAAAEGGVISLHGPAPAPARPGTGESGAHLLTAPLASQPGPPTLLESTDSLFEQETCDRGVAVTDAIPGAATDALSMAAGLRAAAAEADAEEAEVEVRFLGPVEVLGNARPFTRAWAIDLVVYLAVHRAGATTEKWSTALWPDQLMAAATLHSTASAARRCLGVSASGVDHLPRAHGRLTLGPGVTTDWERLKRLSASDTHQSRQAALRLLRGRPFEGLRSQDWTILEGHVAEIETVVVDLALRQAEWALAEAGDPALAEWSARQALKVSAYDERLYRVLLRAADAAGNPARIESPMQELVQLVAEDVEPFDSVHPETLELYRRLSRRPAVRRGA